MKIKKSLGLRETGILILAIAVTMAYLLVSYMNTLSRMSQESCSCVACDMVPFEIPSTFYLGLFGVGILFLVGISMTLRRSELIGEEDRERLWSEKLKTLEDDEKTIYKLLVDANGTMFQSEIVEMTGMTKVKVTRTLDSLEVKKLLERRRRGLTNIVVLK